MIKLADGDKVW